MHLRKLMFGLLSGAAILLGGTGAMAAEKPSTVAPDGYAPMGAQTCLKCHDRAPIDATAIFKTPHAVAGDSRTPFAQNACETCHGPSKAHYESTPAAGQKRVSPAVVFVGPAASSIAERNKVCLGCHENGLRMDWVGSQHESNQIACTDCHTIHVRKDPVLVKATQPEKCFTCHSQQRAESFQYSHHPIREGKVVCADCHNPHGSAGPTLLKKFTLNDVCYKCHAEKRGPFLWEHEPVRDNCTNCHTPHGSTQARLLTERPPFLCVSCHEEGDHQAAPWSGNVTAGINATIAGTLTQGASAAQMLGRGCVNCHSQIHGSNSQGGAFFTR